MSSRRGDEFPAPRLVEFTNIYFYFTHHFLVVRRLECDYNGDYKNPMVLRGYVCSADDLCISINESCSRCC